jgi:superfamily II helicase
VCLSNIDTYKHKKGHTMPEYIKYLAIETAACYNFAPLILKIKEEHKNKHPDATPEEFKALMYKSLKSFTINNQVFEYECQDNYLGGSRWYVLCPKCGRKGFKFYLPKDGLNREQKYLCKKCHRLKNASALMGASKKYRKVVRPLKSLEKIKRALLKKGISPDKAAPLLDAYEKIEKELETSSEYRLWKFQQKYRASN